MRGKIVPDSVKHLQYEIRKVVEDAYKLVDLGVKMQWENIGDPIGTGEQVAPWIREAIADIAAENSSWAYSPTRGIKAAREFIAASVNARVMKAGPFHGAANAHAISAEKPKRG